jgi:hypothetical protein
VLLEHSRESFLWTVCHLGISQEVSLDHASRHEAI